MPTYFHPVAAPPRGLVVPVRVDPTGRAGPTPGQARGPRFRRTTPGLVVPSSAPSSVAQRMLEQAQRLPDGGAVGGWGSLALHGAAYFDGLDATGATRPVPLFLPPGARLGALAGSQVVRRRRAFDVVVRHGIACVDPYDAVTFEAARAPDLAAALVVVDMAAAAGVVDLDVLRALPLDRLPRVGRWQVVAAVHQADARSLSPRETWLRWVWTHPAALPRPKCNWMVLGPDGRHLATPDLLDPVLGVAGDYDGSAHREPGRHRRDEERKEDMRGVGLESVTIVGRGPGDEDWVARRLLAAAQRAREATGPRLWVAREGRLPVR